MPLVVQSVDENSVAQRLGLGAGCLLTAIDGNPLCDALDYQFYTASERFTLTVCEEGKQRDIPVEKDQYEPFGCNFKTYLADEKHSCDNHCMFCFIDQLPPGMRAPLYFKDDDERLSFLYGNYITMTNLSEREVERIIKMHISPIFISVHTTNPALRVRMMANKKAADTLRYLDMFAKGGIEMNCQLVLCRGINDGDELRRTLDDLLALRPHVGSIAAVPAGITDYRDKLFKLTAYDAKTAGETLDILEEYSRRCREQYGRSIVYPSDEWYLTAGREIPPTEFYDDFAQLEDGVGMWRRYHDTFQEELAKPRRLVLPRRIDVVTGTLAAPLIEQMAQETHRRYPGVHITVHAIENRFFGGNVSVAGLVTATDIIDQCRGKLSGHILAVPEVMLQDEEDRFLDDITPEQLGEALGCRVVVIPTDGAGSCRAYLGVRMLKSAPHKPRRNDHMAKPIVAIVGRPNVGKSTIFNKLTGQRIAIVEDTPGVTRDRIFCDCEWNGHKFLLVDTGGIEPSIDDGILAHMRQQAQMAIDSADCIVMVTDLRAGVTPQDHEVASMLMRSGKPVVLAVNKCDKIGDPPMELYDFYALGLGELVPVSGVHGHGTGDLLDAVCAHLNFSEEEQEDEDRIPVAVIGRPNVGKSSLINHILGEDRLIVANEAGTTRDAIDTEVENQYGKFIFTDTAGLRKKGKVESGVERFSVLRSLAAVERSRVCVIMIDATVGFTEQDSKVAGYAHEQGKGCIIAVNKWDAVEKDTYTMDRMRKDLEESFSFMSYAPIIFISAKTGQRIDKLFETIHYVDVQNGTRIPTGALNEMLARATARVQPPSDKGKRLKIFYITQSSTRPPTFVCFVNQRALFHFSYQRYIENQIRENFGLTGTPVRMLVREHGDGSAR